jgi:hypothetical protein
VLCLLVMNKSMGLFHFPRYGAAGGRRPPFETPAPLNLIPHAPSGGRPCLFLLVVCIRILSLSYAAEISIFSCRFWR